MKENNGQLRLLPKEERLLSFFFSGFKKYLCARLAGYRAQSKAALSTTATRVIKKYAHSAGKEEIAKKARGDAVYWWRDLQKAKKYCWAKKKTRDYVSLLKMQGEAIGVLKAKEFEADTGATIILNMDGKAGKAEKKQPKEAKKGPAKLVSLPAQE